MRRATRPWLLRLAMIVLCGGLLFFLWMHGGVAWTRSITAPLIRFFSNIGIHAGQVSSGFRTRAELEEENKRLYALVAQLAEDRSAYDELKQSCNDLQKVVQYAAHESAKPIIARVIGHSVDPFVIADFIDRGSLDGVTLQAPVLARDGVFAGTVTRVWNHSSFVLLATDERSKIPAKVLQRDGALGILEGHGVLYHLTLVPRSVDIQVGDMAVTDMLGTSLPAGLVIGTVSAVSTEPDQPFKTVLITPLVAPESVLFVSVLPPTHSPSL